MGTGSKEVVNKLVETIDISQTILELFGIKARLDNNTISLLETTRKYSITTVTTHPIIRNEKFLSIYKMLESLGLGGHNERKRIRKS